MADIFQEVKLETVVTMGRTQFMQLMYDNRDKSLPHFGPLAILVN
jgi:hypothetical protein